MATIAGFLDRMMIGKAAEAAARVGANHEDDCRLRPFANDDVFVFAKEIDNSRVVKQSDPRAGKAQIWMIGGSVTGAMALVGLLLPGLYCTVSGYRIEELKAQHEKLLAVSKKLDLAEAKITSPQRLETLANDQHYLDPDATMTVYLDTPSDVKVAKNVTKRSKEQAQ